MMTPILNGITHALANYLEERKNMMNAMNLEHDVVGQIVKINNGYLVQACNEVCFVKTPAEIGEAFASLLAKEKLRSTNTVVGGPQLDLFNYTQGV